jgi:eukaryotic-like serine/threonine-protein kinase
METGFVRPGPERIQKPVPAARIGLVRCSGCHATVPDGSRFCPACGAETAGSDITVLADDETRLASGPARATPSGQTTSGWLTSSGSIDHGRFPPGSVLDNRYRILGLLGRGGMGEVYRADDLRLGQAVALKFLPSGLAHDAQRLAQFHTEVRTARQVAHPNVCRVYDIGEIDGEIYLSMEYVDGEDLSSLIRRIGRLPEDKAIEIARQIAAGLAAAHERGVLHRDLKPANIMLDGSGRVRLMDFSLAAVGEVTDIRAGTPGYMAPEQLAGREVSTRSDIYALGLVLYELFTGRRTFEARTLADLVAQQQSGAITPPTEIVKSLDPTIERAIVRCLDLDPARRPASALAVAAALPGGDPLAAALAAGETPSPEMVAASGGESATLTPLAGLTCLTVATAMLLAVAALSDRVSIFAKTPVPKPVTVLDDRAESLRTALGYTEPAVDHASGFAYENTYLGWAQRQGFGKDHWTGLSSGRPAIVRYWYRTSPLPLVPVDSHSAPDMADPPLATPGMTLLKLDGAGRLLQFDAVAPDVESRPPPTLTRVDWTALFTAAGLAPADFTDANPERTPRTYADERRAWEGTLTGTDVRVRIEGAGYRGRPVFFQILGPWSPASRDVNVQGATQGAVQIQFLLVTLLLGLSIPLALSNLRSGRADRRGAFRLAGFMLFLNLGFWILNPHVEVLVVERYRLFVSIGLSMFIAGVLYLAYLAIEPFARRSWPAMLVGWSRLLSGRLRDPVIGRELLFGVVCGACLAAFELSAAYLPRYVGMPDPLPHLPQLNALRGARAIGVTVLGGINNRMQNALILVLEFTIVSEIVRRLAARLGVGQSAALKIATACAFVGAALTSVGDTDLITAGVQAIVITTVLLVMLKVGLFTALVAYTVETLMLRIPLTLEGSRLYAGPAWLMLAAIAAVAAIAFWLARAGEPIFADAPRT